MRRPHRRTLKPWPRHAARAAGLAERERFLDAGADPSRAPALEEQLAALRQERDGLYRALYEAAQFQRKMGGPRRMRWGTFDVAAEIFPVRHVSGDFLLTFDTGRELILAIGDIAGKSLAAGMWFAHLVGLLRLFTNSLRQPAAVASAINDHIAALRPDLPVTSLFLGRLDAHAGELDYCNAGHPAPLVLRGGHSVELLEEGGPLLGALPAAAFAQGKKVLRPGDTLLAFSDGILECRNAAGEEFGMQRIADTARNSRGSAESMLFTVLGAAQDFAGAEPRGDDIALLVARDLGEGTA